jgi:glycosyltransferase involved in cell wall biosynthesis
MDTFAPEAGGPPEAVRMLVKAYVAIGSEVEVVCLNKPDAPYLRDLDCPVHALGQKYLNRYAFSPRLWRWLRANAQRFDGIVMNGIWSFPGLCLYLATRRNGKRYGIFIHGALDPWFNRQYPLKHLKKVLYWPFQYAVLHNAQAVFFTTETEQKLARTSFWPNTWNSVVVPYGICDPNSSSEQASLQTEAFYRKFPELRSRRFLLFLARIHEKKGCDLLIEAFARLAGTVPHTDLVIAGPDQVGLRARLEERARQLGIAARIHWAGMIGGDVKWGALRSCDAFVLPSHQENFGISVVEALAVGRPVLISDQVNIWPQIVEDGVGLVEEDSLEGTLALLRRWFELTEIERNKMAADARGSFLARFDMTRAASAINEIFASGVPGLDRASA